MLNKKQKIEFEVTTEQIFNRKKCILKIPKGCIEHKEKHKCDLIKHKCGFKCKQCERLCELEFGHPQLHYCKHGRGKGEFPGGYNAVPAAAVPDPQLEGDGMGFHHLYGGNRGH